MSALARLNHLFLVQNLRSLKPPNRTSQQLRRRLHNYTGVRFVEVTSAAWDHHVNLTEDLPTNCLSVDKPIAALLKDLKTRGLLNDTLVIWGGQFGRTPYAQNGNGRDHNHKGYAFLAFDYRGWGESESKLLMLEPMPESNDVGEVAVKARAIRWQMDFADQCADIRASIAFVSGETNVDSTRIGIIGTSYGGGLATWIAANDSRVKCAAVQVPGMGGGKPPAAERRAYELLTQQARGETEPVPFEHGAPGVKMATYAHVRYNTAKGIGFDAIKAAEKINVPMLIIDAEKEELMSIVENGQRVADILKANKIEVEYHVIPGIGHYGVYAEKLKEVTELEIAWFENHFKTSEQQKSK